jgi:chaperonin GroEL
MKTNEGYDAEKNIYADMIQAGVIDPTKVTRTALENAASIAALMITTETIVTDIPEEEKAPSMPGGMPPGGGMY